MNERPDQATEESPDHHIIFQNGAWAVLPDGTEEPIRTFDTRDEALRWIGRAMNNQDASIVVHNEDGSVSDTVRPEA